MNFFGHSFRGNSLPFFRQQPTQGLPRVFSDSRSVEAISLFASFRRLTSCGSLLLLIPLLLAGCEKPPTANIPPVSLPPGIPFVLDQPPLPPPSTKGEPYVGVLSGIFSRKDLLVVTGYQGTLLRKEGKAPWRRLPVPDGRDLYGVVATPGGDLWAYGDKGTLLRSSDEGAHWSSVVLSPAPRFLSSVFFVDARTGYAAGAQGALYRTTDGGSQWTALSLPTRENLYAVFFLDASHGLVAGWHRTLLRTSDGGTTWIPVTVPMQRVTRQKPSYNALYGVGGTIYLAGDHGLLFSSTDGGASFLPIQTGSFRDFYGVCRTGDGTLAIAGERGTLLLLASKAGGGWTVRSPLGAFHGSDFLGLSCGATHVRLVGTRNVILLPSH